MCPGSEWYYRPRKGKADPWRGSPFEKECRNSLGNSEGAQALKLLTTASEEVIEKEMAVTGLHVKLLNKPEFLKVGKKRGAEWVLYLALQLF